MRKISSYIIKQIKRVVNIIILLIYNLHKKIAKKLSKIPIEKFVKSTLHLSNNMVKL